MQWLLQDCKHELSLRNTDQISLVELKLSWVLQGQLVDTVQELEKDRTDLTSIIAVGVMTTSLGELVTKVQPFSLHKHLETLEKQHNNREPCYKKRVEQFNSR